MATTARAAQPLGGLTQLSGPAGCATYNGASEAGSGTCTQARGLAGAESAAVSPDGKTVIVGSYPNFDASLMASFTVFSRDASTGALTQLAGTAGCLTTDGSSGAGQSTCIKARGLINAPGDGHDIAFTSDGRWVYMVAQNTTGHSTVLTFQRDPATGALTQLAGTAGCISPDGSSQDGAGTCQTDATLDMVNGISISSDDRYVYATDYGSPKRIHVFARNTSTGALSEVQCISEAPAPAGCTTGRVLGNSEFLALSPDGEHAYGADFQHGLSVFDRDPATGLLTQKPGTAGCLTDDGTDDTGASTCAVARVVQGSYPVLVAPNGATLYDPAATDHGLSVFHINADGSLTQLPGTNGCVTIDGKDNTGAPTCAVGRAVSSPYGGALSPDGSTLYVSEDNTPGGVAIFSVDAATGSVTQLPGLAGCITTNGNSTSTPGQCADGNGLGQGYGMAASPDGRSVYQATYGTANAGLAVYARETGPICQSTSGSTGPRKPVLVSLRCTDADGDSLARSVVKSPAHGTLSAVNNAAETVTYTPAVGFTGTDTFTFAASDGVNSSAPATATIAVAPVPVCQPASASTTSGKSVTVTLRCSDANGDPVTRSIVTHPSHGALSPLNNAAGTVIYTPAAGFSGTDSFTFAASDGIDTSAPATAIIAVNPPDTPTLTGLHASPPVFALTGRRVGRRCVAATPGNRHRPECIRRIAIHLSYTLDMPATVTFTIQRTGPGRRVRGQCEPPTRADRNHHSCTRVLARATFNRAGRNGTNSFTLPSHTGGLNLGPGSFVLLATPSALGATGRQQRASLLIIPTH